MPVIESIHESSNSLANILIHSRRNVKRSCMNAAIRDYNGGMSGSETFAEWLTALMEARGITREDIMSATHASQPTVSRWLSGGRPKLEYCLGISRAFQVPLVEVIQKAGYPVDGVPEYEQERTSGRELLSPSVELAAKRMERLAPGQRRLINHLMDEFEKSQEPSDQEGT